MAHLQTPFVTAEEINALCSYEKIIDNLCKNIGCDVYYWSTDHKIINTLPIEILNQKKYIIKTI